MRHERDFEGYRTFHDTADAGGDGGVDGGAGGVDGGAGGAGTPLTGDAFRATLPEAARAHPSLAKVDSLSSMTDMFISSQKFIGKDPNRLVEFPEQQDDTFRRGVQTRLGLPDTVEGYAALTAPEGSKTDPASPFAKAFTAKAHELGVLPGAVQGLFSWYAGQQDEALATNDTTDTAAHAANVEALKTEFGEAYDVKLRAVGFAVSKLGGNDLKGAIDGAGLGTNPHVVRALATIGELLAGDGSTGDGDDSGADFGGGAMTPAAALARADALTKQAMELPLSSVTERRKLSEEAIRFREIAKKRPS